MNHNELLAEEVQKRYSDYRSDGKSREEAVEQLKCDYTLSRRSRARRRTVADFFELDG